MMFNSVSACTPNSVVTVDFYSSKSQTFNISTVGVILSVNDSVISTRPVDLLPLDHVQVTVTTPNSYLGYQIYEYQLDSLTQTFAIVNKNDYRPSVKTTDARKKWFNYAPQVFLISFYKSAINNQRRLGFNYNLTPNILAYHIVLDHINDTVCFYADTEELISKVYLPAGPIEYRKLSKINPTTNKLETEAVVLCADKKMYRITLRSQSFNTNSFDPIVTPIGSFNNNLPFEADLPSGQSYTDARRAYYRSKINPIVTSFDINQNNTYIWVVGQGSIYYLNNQFELISTFNSALDKFSSIACIGTGAIVVTTLGIIYYVSNSGEFSQMQTLGQDVNSVGTPSTMPDSDFVGIPDPNNRRIIVTNSDASGLYYIPTPNMAPAYARQFKHTLWVTGHDNNTALSIDSTNQIKEYRFDNKITLMSVVGNSYLAVHYLQEFSTLNLVAPTGASIKKIIPFKFDDKIGPLSHIGTRPVRVKMLGIESIAANTSRDLSYWVNGAKAATNTKFNTGDYLGVSFRAYANGDYRRTIVIGETAIDCNFTVKSSTSNSDFFVPNTVALNRYNSLSLTPIQYSSTVNFGNIDTGANSGISLPFNLTMYGTDYSNINVATDGYITFGSTVLTGNVEFGGLHKDALYIEAARDLYLGAPIDNRDPLNVHPTTLNSGNTPGLYYKSGIIEEFRTIRIRWVGTEAQPYPLGNLVTCRATTINSTKVPLTSVTDVNVGDYVSGTGITLSTTVVSITDLIDLNFVAASVNTISKFIKINYDAVALIHFNNSLNLQLVGNPLINYAYINTVGYHNTFVLTAPSNIITSTASVKLILIDTFTNLLVFDGHVDPDVDDSYYVVFTKKPSGLLAYLDGIQTIDILTISITCIGHVGGGPITSIVSEFYVSQADYNKIYINLVITNVTNGTIISKRFDGAYIITTVMTNSISIGTAYTINSTKIQMSGLTATDGYSIYYANVENYSTGPTGPAATPVKFHRLGFEVDSTAYLTVGSILSIQRKSVELSQPASISMDTDLLFKTILPVKELTYEVGISVGRSMQFVEYFYDNSNHLSTTNVGMGSTASLTYTTVAANQSVVFYSDVGVGSWSVAGIGSFDYIDRGFRPYNKFQIIRPVTVPRKNETQIEILMTQTIPNNNDIYISAEFGFLAINGSEYTDNVKIKENDIISLTVPFNTSQRLVTPLISIGNYKFAVPMISDSVFFPNNRTVGPYYGYQVKETVIILDNQLINTYITTTFTIPLTDTYYIPDYYNQLFLLTRTPTITRQVLPAGTYYNLRAGDIITIENILTPSSIYDVYDILVSTASRAIRISVRTGSGPVFNYIDFGTLVEPYARGLTYTIDPLYSSVSYVGDLFSTSDITLTATTAISGGGLYIDTAYANIIINNVDKGRYATNVSTGDIISLRRTIVNYVESNVTLYQVKTDTTILSKVYIPIGNWGLQNKVIVNEGLAPTEKLVTGNIAPTLVSDSSPLFKMDTQFEAESSTNIKIKSTPQHLATLNYLNVPKIDNVKFQNTSIGMGRMTFSKLPRLSLSLSEVFPTKLYSISSRLTANVFPELSKTSSYIKLTQGNLVLPHSISYLSVGSYMPLLPHNITYLKLGGFKPLLPHNISYLKLGGFEPLLPYNISYLKLGGFEPLLPYNISYNLSETFKPEIDITATYYKNQRFNDTISTISTYYLNDTFRTESDAAITYYTSTEFKAKTDTVSTYNISDQFEINRDGGGNDFSPDKFEINRDGGGNDFSPDKFDINLLPGGQQFHSGSVSNLPTNVTLMNSNMPYNRENDFQLPDYNMPYNRENDFQLPDYNMPYNTENNVQLPDYQFPFKREIDINENHYRNDANTINPTTQFGAIFPPSKINATNLSIYLTPITIHRDIMIGDISPVMHNKSELYASIVANADPKAVELYTYIDPIRHNKTYLFDTLKSSPDPKESVLKDAIYSLAEAKVAISHTDLLPYNENIPTELIPHMDLLMEIEDPFKLLTPLTSTYDSKNQTTTDLLPYQTTKNYGTINDLSAYYNIENQPAEYLAPIYNSETIASDELASQLDIETNILTEIIPQLDIETNILTEIIPEMDIGINPLVDARIINRLDVETILLPKITPEIDIERRSLIPLISEFQTQIMYTTKELDEVSAFSTYIKIYALGNLGDTATYVDPTTSPLGKPFSMEYNYVSAAYRTRYDASVEAGKYKGADVVKVGTDYWNYRIYFNTRHFCIPKKGRLFPTSWYISGG
ncbi:hypothetical protein UFOVP1636_202 [uncultured Caudovirales phage]|uniref:Uncharacterized protein n=1 Tax=uncultured Caudovirales phage TaxID=2100421 RepID=A0A6J5T2M6_9CAUD|nr:hypothetical protein UFOVP1636_202 [uncultured Caudovirales phage]